MPNWANKFGINATHIVVKRNTNQYELKSASEIKMEGNNNEYVEV